MSELPTGVVAFLFTDIVASTRLWAEAGTAMAGDLRSHDEILRSAAQTHSGHVFSTAGDSFAIVFASASQAAHAAIDAQNALAQADWGVPGGVTVRMGIHVGEAIERDGDYFGPTVNTTARLMAAGHGGQILVSGQAADVLRDIQLRALGEHQLRDVATPVRVHQVAATGFAADHPPLHTLAAFTSTLPQQRSSFIGRDEELTRLGAMLGRSRVVTITGVGGAGKTRVAIEVGAAEQPRFSGGVFFVDLAHIDDPEAVAGAVAAGIGINITSIESTDNELRRFVRERVVLLVMDNCEHLLDPVAELLDELLAISPGLKVLATSREALEIDGEETYRLPSLAADGAAFRLFVDRATAVNDRFEVNDANRETIVDLCRRVDGMPLAIELAASRCRTSTPSELLAGLDDRFSLLRAGRKRGVVARQRTLEATIEWSYDLLEDSERAFFRRLGVFAGSFAADVVATVTQTSAARARDLLDSLVAKSLVVTNPMGASQTCFRLLETVKAFAIDRMVDQDEIEATSKRHAEAYIDYCREHFDQWRDRVATRSQADFEDGYLTQVADLHAAVDHLIDCGRYEDAVIILRCGSRTMNGTGAAGVAAFARLETLNSLHRDALSDAFKAELDGTRATALMDAGRFLDASAVAQSATLAAGLPIQRRLLALSVHALLAGSISPPTGIETCDAALAELAGQPGYESGVYEVAGLRTAFKAMLRHYTTAYDEALADIDVHAGSWFEYRAPTLFWLAHLTGRRPPQQIVALAESLPIRNRGYTHSIRLAQLMALGDDLAQTSKAIVELADASLTGRLPLGESEFLVAFARLAQLRGEADRALALVEYSAPRAPWTNTVMAEILGSLEGWTDDDWQPKRTEDLMKRVDLAWLAQSRERMPAQLAEEMNRWR